MAAIRPSSAGRAAGQRGFTLMEMMMALLIGAIVLTPLYVITRGMARESNIQQMETEAIQRARVGLEKMLTDFERAGMMVSPHPQVDPDSIVSSAGGGTHAAWDRQAVVHLNRGATSDNDAVILVGAFENPSLFEAQVDVDQLTILGGISQDDCLDTFNPGYAFAHIFSTTGQHLDARIVDVSFATDTCTVTLDGSELVLNGPGAFAVGQTVHVSGNQAVLYRVDAVNEDASGSSTHNALMRYYVDYSSALPSCVESDFDNLIFPSSARMVADYVNDFQVWFRTVSRTSSTDSAEMPRPIMHSMDLSYVPDDDYFLVGVTDPDAQNSAAGSLACQHVASMVGPEHVRSAIIRIGVRSEKTDQSVKVIEPGSADVAADWAALGTIAGYNLAPPPAGDVGAYKVRTLMTEVPMPNLMAKVASFPDDIPAP